MPQYTKVEITGRIIQYLSKEKQPILCNDNIIIKDEISHRMISYHYNVPSHENHHINIHIFDTAFKSLSSLDENGVEFTQDTLDKIKHNGLVDIIKFLINLKKECDAQSDLQVTGTIKLKFGSQSYDEFDIDRSNINSFLSYYKSNLERFGITQDQIESSYARRRTPSLS